MRLLAVLFLAYTIGMLLIHLSTWRLLKAWDRSSESWVKRRLPPQRVLRVEALYWSLSLAGLMILPPWPATIWKVAIFAFAIIHLGIWMVAELRGFQWTAQGVPSAGTSKMHRLIIAFDLLEAGALIAIAWSTFRYISQFGHTLAA